MKRISLLKYPGLYLLVYLMIVAGCNDSIVDFGFDGSLSGQILDQSGSGTVQGDITSGNFFVNALGEHDEVSIVIRVKDDGTFANTALYPQAYQVWVIGPFIESPTERVDIDLNEGRQVIHDFQVTPFLNLSSPRLNGNPLPTEITIDYNISGNEGHVAQIKEVYCSTVRYPTTTTGNGPDWHTIRMALSADEGTVTIPGLTPGTRYFIRVGARATGETAWNFSDQLIVNTP